MSKWLERMFYAEEPGVALGALSQSLRPLGAIYGAASRRHLARARAHSGYRAKVPVISVGNYVVGGGGKTPTVLLLAQWLKKEGLRPAVLIRGYGGANKPQRIIGAIAHEQRLVVGDEASLIARRLNDVPVYVGRDRVASAKSAQDEADVLLLDDGLQHPALHRDWDVVCFKGAVPWGTVGVFRPAPCGSSCPTRSPLARLGCTLPPIKMLRGRKPTAFFGCSWKPFATGRASRSRNRSRFIWFVAWRGPGRW